MVRLGKRPGRRVLPQGALGMETDVEKPDEEEPAATKSRPNGLLYELCEKTGMHDLEPYYYDNSWRCKCGRRRRRHQRRWRKGPVRAIGGVLLLLAGLRMVQMISGARRAPIFGKFRPGVAWQRMTGLSPDRRALAHSCSTPTCVERHGWRRSAWTWTSWAPPTAWPT